MSKARVIGACSAGSTIYHCNVNLNTAGGNKKQGLPFQLDRRTFQHRAVKRLATGDKRDYIFTMNQIGGIGRVSWYPRDGIRPREPYKYGTTPKLTSVVLTCDAEYENTPGSNLYSYVIDDIRYVIVPEVSCNPFTIHTLNLTFPDSMILSFANLTYIPNGPTINDYTGYVFKTNITNIPVDFDVYTTNFNCSTVDVNTLVIQPSGFTDIEIVNNGININGKICDNITTILYNGNRYTTALYIYNSYGASFYMNETLESAIFTGSIQCI